tara:strand:- start:164 stop:766 length:603 start_codon:yes stop_codon:yes gene_type:complete
VCLGAQARAANETARRQYKYQNQKREREWMQELNMAGVERIQYDQGINNTNLGLANVYADIQANVGELEGTFRQDEETAWKKFLSESPSSSMAASGQTGASARRIANLDLAEYLTNSSRRGREVSQAKKDLVRQGQETAAQVKQQQEQMFAKQAFVRVPGLAPPQPVMQNVGAAAFMDALSIGTKIITAGGSGGLGLWGD